MALDLDGAVTVEAPTSSLSSICELVGGVPDLSAAASWEAPWRAARNKAVQRRRAAS